MYRIAVIYERNHPRMSGKSAGSAKVKRGVWRVIYCWPAEMAANIRTTWSPYDNCYVLQITSATRKRIGTLCNPRRILAEYQAQRNLCRVVERIADKPEITGYGVTI